MAELENIGAVLLGVGAIITAIGTAYLQYRSLKKQSKQLRNDFLLQQQQIEVDEADVATKLSASAIAWINRLEQDVTTGNVERKILRDNLAVYVVRQEEIERTLKEELEERDEIIKLLCRQSQALLEGIKILLNQMQEREIVPRWTLPSDLITIPPILDNP